MSSLYPLFADLANRPVLVVGGGAVGERKAEALRAAGARVTVGAPTLTATLARRARNGRLRHRPGRFDPSWLHGVWLVIAATNDRSLNRRVAAVATTRRIWVNVVDDPALSSFQVPAVVHRPPLVVAISSGGAVPALARHVRERLESVLDDALSVLAGLLARHRASIRDRIADIGVRRRFYDEVITGEVGDLVRRRQPDRAERALLRHLGRSTSRSGPRPGNVALVGAGPGDPGLLTLAGLRRLQAADVILHDRLVGPGVLALARRDAELIDVGKRPGRQGGGQDAINALMVTLAGAGRRVVRLKGGDPFIFGRGGEELEHLHRHGVPYEVIPGITAASACAAYAGIPLTHRDHAQSVRLVTAHCQSSLDLLDWPALAQERQTLAVYMAVGQLARLREQLIHNGRDPATPFALVENGTTQHQRVVTGTLASLSEVSKTHAVSSPALLIIGEVAALAGPLAWFGMPPLSGSRSRARHAA